MGVLSAVIIGVYVVALMNYCDGKIFQADINLLDDYDNKLMDARTVAFISLVWAENVRSYTSRSFNRPVWQNLLGNANMQKAIVLAQLCLYAAVLVPFFSDKILGLRGIAVGAFGWFLALVGPIGCVILCELAKLITAMQSRQYQEKLAMQRAAEEAAFAAAAPKRAKSVKMHPSPVVPAASNRPAPVPDKSSKKAGAEQAAAKQAKKGCKCGLMSLNLMCWSH